MSQPRVCRAEALPRAPGTQPEDSHVPVLVVGAGACGLTAALMLHDAGIACAVLERDALPRGSTALSSGFIPAASTRAQRALGIVDSPAQLALDIQRKAKGMAAEHLVQAYAKAIGPAIDALAERHGLQWHLLDTFLYPGHSVHRMHTVPETTGAGLMDHLLKALANTGVPLLTQAKVHELWVNNNDTIMGLGYLTPDGQVHHLGCDALLLACNGFGGNASMVAELIPEMAQATFGGHVGNDGSAVLWGQQLPAQLADMGAYQGHGSWAVPQGALVSGAWMREGGVQINALGERFHDETQGYSEAAMQVLAQPGGVAWNVIDDPLLALARTFPDFVQAQDAGAVTTCADLAALARHIGCDSVALHTPLAAGPDRAFKRLLQAPFHAIKVTGALFHTQGGLAIDAHCRVLRPDGQPFPNLLAAGGAARGVSGPAVWGYLSGNGLLSAVAGAYIAANTLHQHLASPL